MTDNPIQKNHCEYYPCDVKANGDYCPVLTQSAQCATLKTAFSMIDCVEKTIECFPSETLSEKEWSILQSLRRMQPHIEIIKREIEG